MLTGFDVSHHNTKKKIQTFIDNNKPSFAFIKVTEGVNWDDPLAEENYSWLKDTVDVIGFYHYARAEKNDAVDEAEHFLDKVKDIVGPAGGEFLLALDFEGLSKKAKPEWIRLFNEHIVNSVVGKPLIYMDKSTFPNYRTAFDDNGLWLAHWGEDYSKDPHLYGYLIAFHQTGLKDGIDYDVFFGDMEQLKKYRCHLSPTPDYVNGCSCNCTCKEGSNER